MLLCDFWISEYQHKVIQTGVKQAYTVVIVPRRFFAAMQSLQSYKKNITDGNDLIIEMQMQAKITRLKIDGKENYQISVVFSLGYACLIVASAIRDETKDLCCFLKFGRIWD